MIVIYKPNGSPLLGFKTANGDIITSYGQATSGQGVTTYTYTNADGEYITTTTEPTPVGMEVNDDSQRTTELMGDDVLTLRFSLAENLTIPLRSWCIFEGKRYYLYLSPEITKQHDRNFEYVMPMYSSDYMLKITMMRNSVDKRLKFPYTATPREHLEMIVANLNDAETGRDDIWAVDYSKTIGMVQDANGAHTNYDGTKYNDEGSEELANYEFNYCIDAIRNTASIFNTEYEISDVAVASGGITTVYHLLSFHDVEYNKDTPLYMSYGKGKGFKRGIARKNESDLPPVDRLYIQGGAQNIPANYGRTPIWDNTSSAVVFNGDKSDTLLLPRWLKNTSNGIPTTTSEYRGVACFYSGGKFWFSVNPSIQTDSSGNRYVQAKDYIDPEYGAHIYETLYDEDGNGLGTVLLMVPTPCYLVSDDGRSVERVRHTYYDPDYSPRGTKVESFYDATEIYPMRVGGVSHVATINRTRQVDDGQGGTTTETYKLYDIIDALTDCPDYSQCSIDGETMTVIFQDGMLAGREFDLNTTESGVVICNSVTVYDADNNPIPAKRMELCPSDQDGLTMPNETFKPRPGDHYIAFHCSLPKEYVGCSVADSNGHYGGSSGIAYGAEFRALKEMVRYLHSHGKETFTFSGTVDTLWAKAVWDEYVEQYTGSPYYMNIPHHEYFAVGQHIKVIDVQLFGSQGLVLRVTGLRQYVNNPKAPELTLSNALVLKYNWVKQLSQTVEEVRIRRRPRPLNPYYPKPIEPATREIIAEEMLDASGNLLDLRRKSVTPINLFGSVVGLNASSGLRGTVGSLNTYTRTTLVAKINEYRTALQSVQTQFRDVQSKFNTLRNALVDANGKYNNVVIDGIGIGQCSVVPGDSFRPSHEQCTYSDVSITIPTALDNPT